MEVHGLPEKWPLLRYTAKGNKRNTLDKRGTTKFHVGWIFCFYVNILLEMEIYIPSNDWPPKSLRRVIWESHGSLFRFVSQGVSNNLFRITKSKYYEFPVSPGDSTTFVCNALPCFSQKPQRGAAKGVQGLEVINKIMNVGNDCLK